MPSSAVLWGLILTRAQHLLRVASTVLFAGPNGSGEGGDPREFSAVHISYCWISCVSLQASLTCYHRSHLISQIEKLRFNDSPMTVVSAISISLAGHSVSAFIISPHSFSSSPAVTNSPPFCLLPLISFSLLQLFERFGQIENIKELPNANMSFVKYRHRIGMDINCHLVVFRGVPVVMSFVKYIHRIGMDIYKTVMESCCLKRSALLLYVL